MDPLQFVYFVWSKSRYSVSKITSKFLTTELSSGREREREKERESERERERDLKTFFC
jgi:hypothetical protein